MRDRLNSQENRILKVLQDADGNFVRGRKFLHEMFISQYHARIFSLQQKGYNIEPSKTTDEHGYKSYRLIAKEKQLEIF